MTRLGSAPRYLALAIAIAGVIDPRIPLPMSKRPAVRVIADAASDAATDAKSDAAAVADALSRAGFAIDPSRPEAASVLVTDRAPAVSRPSVPTWVVDRSPASPNIRIAHAETAASRLPDQALELRVTLEADGVRGATTGIVVEDGGIPVASARHEWIGDRERWQTSLQYLPLSGSAGRLRLRAAVAPGETRVDDNVADIAVPPVRGALRTLVVEAAVSWPALFVRRALEGENAFSVSALQHASRSVTTRAGGPPIALTQSALAPFEAVVIGGPDLLTVRDLDALRWFVEVRGGLAVLVPDERPSGRYTELLGSVAIDARTLDAAVRLGDDIFASELLVARSLPPGATAVATDPDGHAVVFRARRGAGTVIFSGALDAWRHRERGDAAFTRFWKRAVGASVTAVPPPLAVAAEPSLARPGEWITVTARLRDTELESGADRFAITGVTARAVGPATRADEPIRLWPTAEPEVFSGRWRAETAGAYNITVTEGTLRGDAAITVAPDVVHPHPSDATTLGLIARASGGQMFRRDHLPELVAAMASAYPARRSLDVTRPMRSPWWCIPFAALLCTEWTFRRRRGLA